MKKPFKGPVTLLRIVLAYASVLKISLIRRYTLTYNRGTLGIGFIRFKHGRIRWYTLAYGETSFLSMLKNLCVFGRMVYTISIYSRHTLNTLEVRQMYGTHALAFQRIFVRMKIISLIFIRFSYVSLIRNSVTGP